MAVQITNLLDVDFSLPIPVGTVLRPRETVEFPDVSYTDIINNPRFITMMQHRNIRVVNREPGRRTTLRATAEDMDIWVAADGSSDNDGTKQLPYDTLTRAMDDIPFNINHVIHIRIGAGTYTEQLPKIRNSFGANGHMCIEGIGEPTVHAGPFTVNTFASGSGSSCTTVVVTGAGWTANEFYGKWIKVTAGTGTGHVFPVHTNDTDTIYFAYVNTASVGTVTEIEIIDGPATTLEFERSLCISGAEKNVSANLGWDYLRFTVGGIRFKTDSVGINTFVIDKVMGLFVFTVFQSPAPTVVTSSITRFYDSLINYGEPSETVFDNPVFSIGTCGGIQVKRGDTKYTGSAAAQSVELDNTSIFRLTAPNYAKIIGVNGYLGSCTFGHVIATKCNASLDNCLIDVGESTWVRRSMTLATGTYYLGHVYFPSCSGDDAVGLFGASLDLYSVSSNAANIAGYAVRIYAGGVVTNESSASFNGTLNDTLFVQTATANAWPAGGAAVTDSQGAWVITKP